MVHNTFLVCLSRSQQTRFFPSFKPKKEKVWNAFQVILEEEVVIESWLAAGKDNGDDDVDES